MTRALVRRDFHYREFAALISAGVLFFLLFATPQAAKAGDIFTLAGGAQTRLKVQSMAELKFNNVVRQQYDFSCGSAALATLLTYHYGRPITETDAFRSMWEVGDQERIKQLGFSLFEMKTYLEREGLKADGFKLTLERIEEIGVPGIALIDVNGYRHFVVIKGVTNKTVLFGDPSRGMMTKSREEFEEIWDGIILFVRSDVARGKKNFNKYADWKLMPAAPGDRALDRETLQSVTLTQTRSVFSGFAISVPDGQ